MAKRSKGKGNRKPIKKKLTQAQINERNWQTAYDKAEQRYNKLISEGFIYLGKKFVNESGDFYWPKPKRYTKSTVETLQRFTKENLRKQMKYVNPETDEIKSWSWGVKYLADQRKREKQLDEEWEYETPPYRKESELAYVPEEPEQYTPANVDIYDVIISIINKLPDVKWIGRDKYHNFEPDKKLLESALWDIVDEINNMPDLKSANNAEVAYTHYLESHLSDIENAVLAIEWPSDEAAIQEAVIEAYIYITNNRQPPLDIAKRLEV